MSKMPPAGGIKLEGNDSSIGCNGESACKIF